MDIESQGIRTVNSPRGANNKNRKSFNFINSGFNLRPTETSAAIGYSQLKINSSIQPTIRNGPILTSLKKPDWNWSWYICKDHQTKRIGRFHLAESCTGDWRTTSDNIKAYGNPDEFIQKYMTQKGIRELFA